ncbi:hypothetical protein [Streptomyces sp. NPDC087300]|uniref:hypothetical protein n=1 Tax=Streptomyces sp. NPDC087300 TaxID=3365780 RepID=UPI00382BA41F
MSATPAEIRAAEAAADAVIAAVNEQRERDRALGEASAEALIAALRKTEGK